MEDVFYDRQHLGDTSMKYLQERQTKGEGRVGKVLDGTSTFT